jgi:hypothetical protein
MSFKFPNFKIEDKNININIQIEPVTAMTIVDGDNLLYSVVIDNISRVKGGGLLNCKVPYYLSDGYTNNFRANMLFPFFGFNIPKPENKNYPYSNELVEGTLFKINLVKNMNIKILEERILKNFKKKVLDYNDDNNTGIIPEELITRMIDNSRNNSRGVLSVLKRLSNILDFIISINSEMITNSFNPGHFRPVIDRINKYNPREVNNTRFYPSENQLLLNMIFIEIV